MKSEMPYYLAFSHFLGIGPMKFAGLVAQFGSVQKAYGADTTQIEKIVGRSYAQKWSRFRSTFDPVAKLQELEKKEIVILTQEDDRYPLQLKQIADAPICLYVKGDLSLFDFENDTYFAIVGTRKPSSYGQHITRMFSKQLAEAGVVLVSGMAIGIDTITHMSALDHGSRTVVFMGCGVDIVYPPQNRKLYNRILTEGGLVISEFPPGITVLPGLFVARNRLISGLSKGVLVVEGTHKSGGLITARYAAEQGKEVFAPPVPLTSDLSEAPTILLKEGATLVTSGGDILTFLNIHYQKGKEIIVDLTSEEERIVTALQSESLSSDELSRLLHMPIHSLLSLLSILEMKGCVVKSGEGKYVVTS